ncbi:MAG: adenosine deaminase [Lachnospiraceae bacterium]|nr:adenosine deaminase [Lachnospiraceae bacterium]MDD3795719.1 adenosine deaminase [Lachnospiraceae bacterium]
MIDLHLHLDGSLAAEDVLRMAEMSGVGLLGTDPVSLRAVLTASEDCGSLLEYFDKFKLPLQVLQTRETISYALERLLERLESQGLCYAEIRFAPQLHMQRGLSQRQVVEAAAEAVLRYRKKGTLSANLILCCMRGSDLEKENRETIRLTGEYLGYGVAGADLAGDEVNYKTEWFAPLFAAAAQEGIPFTIHAGEAAGADSVKAAVKMGARRIGHGIRAAEDDSVIELLKEREIPLEMCYTSNLQTKAVLRPGQYPIRKFLDAGLKVTLNTDNMTVSDTNIKKEYQRIKADFSLTAEELAAIVENSVNAAFLEPKEKERLHGLVKEKLVLI